jgi:hypothetical protein
MGTTQFIKIASDPPGADCTMSRNGAVLARKKTPGFIEVSRSRRPISVVCTKEGYQDGQTTIESRRAAPADYVSTGPSIVSGLASSGSLFDMMTAGDTHYQTVVTERLEPLSSSQ